MRFILLTLFFMSALYGKVLYMSYDSMPKRVIKGEIFSVTIKVLSTAEDTKDIEYKFLNPTGIKAFSNIPDRVIKGNYYFEKFYFLATAMNARVPHIKATIITTAVDVDSDAEENPLHVDNSISNIDNYSSILKGKKLKVVKLNPKENFSNIIADNFELVRYKTTSYDNLHNIIVLTSSATNSDIAQMKFKNVFKQETESISTSHLESKITYVVVIDKKIENFTFSYFNLKKNNFINISIPIVIDDDSVVTQSDLTPQNQTHERIKMYLAILFSIIFLAFMVWRKKYIYTLLIVIPLYYVVQKAMPEKEVCISEGAKIYLLPVLNGTIFEVTKKAQHLQREGNVKEFVKVKLHNDKIGWVNNEDICSF